jgi:hypothetical protein
MLVTQAQARMIDVFFKSASKTLDISLECARRDLPLVWKIISTIAVISAAASYGAGWGSRKLLHRLMGWIDSYVQYCMKEDDMVTPVLEWFEDSADLEAPAREWEEQEVWWDDISCEDEESCPPPPEYLQEIIDCEYLHPEDHPFGEALLHPDPVVEFAVELSVGEMVEVEGEIPVLTTPSPTFFREELMGCGLPYLIALAEILQVDVSQVPYKGCRKAPLVEAILANQ